MLIHNSKFAVKVIFLFVYVFIFAKKERNLHVNYK